MSLHRWLHHQWMRSQEQLHQIIKTKQNYTIMNMTGERDKVPFWLTCGVAPSHNTWRDNRDSLGNEIGRQGGSWVGGDVGFRGGGAHRHDTTGGVIRVRHLLAAVIISWVRGAPAKKMSRCSDDSISSSATTQNQHQICEDLLQAGPQAS